MPTVRQTLNEVYYRGTQRQKEFEALMKDHDELKGMKQTLDADRVTSGDSEINQKILEVIQRADEHEESFLNTLRDTEDLQKEGEGLILSLSNPRWQQVLRLRYLARCGWKEIAAELHTTDDAVKGLHARAVEHLESLKDFQNN